MVASVPVPTGPQVQYQQSEIVGMISWNMFTYQDDNYGLGCNEDNWNNKLEMNAGPLSDPMTFNPAKLDIDNWIESFKDAGIAAATLTAKHCCGFTLWPTKATFDDGTPYGYDVSNSQSPTADIVKEFAEKMRNAGLGVSIYYSLAYNFFLNAGLEVNDPSTLIPNQRNVTQAEYQRIGAYQLEELWSSYGDLFEIWFDGGYSGEMKEDVSNLLRKVSEGEEADSAWENSCITRILL